MLNLSFPLFFHPPPRTSFFVVFFVTLQQVRNDISFTTVLIIVVLTIFHSLALLVPPIDVWLRHVRTIVRYESCKKYGLI